MSGTPLFALVARAAGAALASSSLAGSAARAGLCGALSRAHHVGVGQRNTPAGFDPTTPACFLPAWRAPGTLCEAQASTSSLPRSVAHSVRRFAGSPAVAGDADRVELGESAIKRLHELQAADPGEQLVLRLSVEAGGCSGFQYKFDICTHVNDDDVVVERDGATLVCDAVSLEFVRGSTVTYEEDLIRAGFEVASNPNSESSCGCGTSFVAKM